MPSCDTVNFPEEWPEDEVRKKRTSDPVVFFPVIGATCAAWWLETNGNVDHQQAWVRNQPNQGCNGPMNRIIRLGSSMILNNGWTLGMFQHQEHDDTTDRSSDSSFRYASPFHSLESLGPPKTHLLRWVETPKNRREKMAT